MIRNYEYGDKKDVLNVWKECKLLRSWKNPKLDIDRKKTFQKDLVFVGEVASKVIATAMFGYDGHRGWLNYLGVIPKFQNRGFGKELLMFGEAKLVELDCPKLNLQIRTENEEAINFYKASGYSEDGVISFGKRLIED